MNMITTISFSFSTILTKLDKITSNGKKNIENLLNNLFEIDIIKKNEKTAQRNLFILFQNVNTFDKTVLKFEIQTILRSLQEKIEEIEVFTTSFARNFAILFENFKGLFAKNEEKIDFMLLQKEISSDFQRKELRKFFLLMKILSISSKISDSLRKDCDLKKDVLGLIAKKAGFLLEDEDSYESSLEDLKYYLQLWIFRPYIDEVLIELFSDYLKNFTKN